MKTPTVVVDAPAVPTASLAEYTAQHILPKWLAAALRTECPIEQHMRHGRSTDPARQAEYEAHVDLHRKPVADWDKLTEKIKGAV